MKQLFALAIIAATFAACNGSSNSSGTPAADTVPTMAPATDTSAAMKMDSASSKMDTTTMKTDTTKKM